jgi:hypothetical protein
VPAALEPIHEVVQFAGDEREGDGSALALLLRIVGYVKRAQLGDGGRVTER